MSDYRLYLFDQTRKPFQCREISCDTDVDAMSNAYGLLAECHAVEVWTGPRMVARVPRPALATAQPSRSPPVVTTSRTSAAAERSGVVLKMTR